MKRIPRPVLRALEALAQSPINTSALARRLNREHKGKGERITENTLIRWAVDMLLERYRVPREASEKAEELG